VYRRWNCCPCTPRCIWRKGVCCHPSRKVGRARLDGKLYRTRYRVECSFYSLKRFRGVATRYDKRRENYLGMVYLACISLWLN